MADPATLGIIITGLVGVVKAYTSYKAATAKNTNAPKDSTVSTGEHVAPALTNAIKRHGTAKEQMTLQSFEQDPEVYEEPLKRVLIRLAEQNQGFAAELQTLAQQANIQTGGSQGTVNVSGNSTIYGPVAGTNHGTINSTYSLDTHQRTKDSKD